MSSASSPAGRLPGLDALKAIAIVCVVLIHAVPTEAELYRTHGVNGLARLAVPLFLVVTGFLSGWRDFGREHFRRTFFKFLGLHLVYGAFYWVVNAVRTGSPGPMSPKGILVHFGEAAYPGQFYFVILLQLCFAAAFLLPSGFWKWRASVVLAAVLCIATQPFPFIAEQWLSDEGISSVFRRLLASGSMLWLWLHYFTLGGWLGAKARAGNNAQPNLALGLGFATVGATIATLGLPAGAWEDPMREPYARWSIFIGASLVALGLPWLARLSAPAPLRRLGAASFGVFVLHPALLMGCFAWLGAPQDVLTSWFEATLALGGALALTLLLQRHARWLLA